MNFLEAKYRADCIARDMNAHNPVATHASPDGGMITIIFDIIPDGDKPWSKAVECESIHADAPMMSRMLSEWKRQKAHEIRTHEPAPVVRQAIAIHGLKKVMKALA